MNDESKAFLARLKQPPITNGKRCKKGHLNPQYVNRCSICFQRIRKPRTVKKQQ